MTRAAIYLRVSTEEQSHNNSLPTQQRECQQYAEHHAMTVVSVLTDDETGATTHRPGLSELRYLVQRRQIDAVIIHSVDRFHRNLVNQVLIRNELQSAGIVIHYVRRGALKDTPEDRFTDNIEAAVAEYEREKIRERTMRGAIGKLESGKPSGAGRAPYGYTYVGDRQNRTLTINETEAAIVREIFTRFAGGDSVVAIMNDFAERKIPTWSNQYRHSRSIRPLGQWNQATLYDILHEELYAGVYWHLKYRKRGGKISRNHNPGDWIAVPAPALISRELWEAVQEKIAYGQKFSPRNAIHQYQLRGMIRCAKCGAAMTGMTRPTGKSYYRCVNNHMRVPVRCGVAYVRAADADRLAWEAVQQILDPEHIAHEVEILKQRQAATQATRGGRLVDLERQRESIQSQINRMLEAYRLGVTRIEILQSQTAPLNAQLDEIDRKIAALPTDDTASVDAFQRFLAQDYDKLVAALSIAQDDLETQRAILMRLGTKVVALQERRGPLTITVTTHLNTEPLTLTAPYV